MDQAILAFTAHKRDFVWGLFCLQKAGGTLIPGIPGKLGAYKLFIRISPGKKKESPFLNSDFFFLSFFFRCGVGFGVCLGRFLSPSTIELPGWFFRQPCRLENPNKFDLHFTCPTTNIHCMHMDRLFFLLPLLLLTLSVANICCGGKSNYQQSPFAIPRAGDWTRCCVARDGNGTKEGYARWCIGIHTCNNNRHIDIA